MSVEEALQEIMDYYRSRGMARELGAGSRPALLVIDFQKGLTDETRPAGCNLDAEISHTLQLLEKVRQKNLPVFFFVLGYRDPVVEGGLMMKKLPVLESFTLDSDNTALDDRFEVRSGEHLWVKHHFSCFQGTPLVSALTFLGIDTLLLTGCITSGCIRATASDALQRGFRALVPRECVGDRSSIPHEVNLMDIHARCGDVLPLERVLAYVDSL